MFYTLNATDKNLFKVCSKDTRIILEICLMRRCCFCLEVFKLDFFVVRRRDLFQPEKPVEKCLICIHYIKLMLILTCRYYSTESNLFEHIY